MKKSTIKQSGFWLILVFCIWAAPAQAAEGEDWSPASEDSHTAQPSRYVSSKWAYQPTQGPRRASADRARTAAMVSTMNRSATTLLPAAPLVPSAQTPGAQETPLMAMEEPSARMPASPEVEPFPHIEHEPAARSYKPPVDTGPLSMQPRTQSTIDVGAQVSHYHYHEPSLAVKLQGAQYGVTAAATGTFGRQWFARAEGRFVGGPLTYKGTGESDDNANVIGELRTTVGRDFLWDRFAFSPYAGLGYRYLRSDTRGPTSFGAYGYRRDSNYFFVPVGVQKRVMFDNRSQLALTAEVDPLLYGRQKSYLDDVSLAYPTMTNRQKTGFGVRSDVMYKWKDLAVGPFVNYWSIEQSDSACSDGDGSTLLVCGYEPKNHTLEYGLQFRYSFY